MWGLGACNMQNRFYFTAFGSVFGQRKTAFTVGNITAERLSLPTARRRSLTAFSSFDAVRPTKIV